MQIKPQCVLGGQICGGLINPFTADPVKVLHFAILV